MNRLTGSPRAFLIGATLLLAAIRVAAQADHFLDLTSIDREHRLGTVPRGERMTLPPVVVSSHSDHPAPPIPLKMTLLSFDAARYALQDQFIYELRLENIGSESVDVPSSVDNSQFRQDAPGTQSILIALKDADGSGVLPLASADFYGSASVAGSLITLPPGGTIRLRGSGIWEARNVPTGWGTRAVNVRASLDRWIVGQEVYHPAESINGITVEVRER